MSLYSSIADVRREFKSVLDSGTVITNDKIVEFLYQANALINSYIGSVYSVPLTGNASVSQADNITVSTVADATEYKLLINAHGVEKIYSYTSGAGATANSILSGILALIEADKDALVDGEVVGSALTVESKIVGGAYTIGNESTDLVIVNTVAAVTGSYGLRLLRRIESELAACKIAEILRTKVAKKLESSAVKQEIKDGSCWARNIAMLKEIKKGSMKLDGAELETTGGGLESFGQACGFEGDFDRESKQW